MLDVFHRPVSAGGDGLHRGPAEPVDHRPAADEAEEDRGIGEAQGEEPLFFEREDDREDHRRRPHHRRADEHRLGSRLEGVAGRVIGLEIMLPLLEVGREAEVALDLLLDPRDLFCLGELEHRLGVVGDRAVTVDGDRHRPHAEEAKGDQAKGEDRGIFPHHLIQPQLADDKRPKHQPGNQHAVPEGTEIASHEPGEDRQGGASLARGGHDFVDML